MGEGTNIRFGQTYISKWSCDREFTGGDPAGADFPLIVIILPISQDLHAAKFGHLLHPIEKFRSTEVAAIWRVGSVRGVVKFECA